MGRRDAKTRQELVQAEFGQSRDHFRQATQHAASGMGAALGPRLSDAKVKIVSVRERVGPGTSKVSNMASQGWTSTVAVLSPIADAARDGHAKSVKLPATKGGKSNGEGRRTPVGLLSLVAAGAAIGAAGALVARRRNRARWAEYQPDELQGDAASMGMTGEQHGATAKLAAWAKENTRTAMGTVRGKMRPADHGPAVPDSDEMNERVAEATGAPTKDLRDAVPGETAEPPADAGPAGSMADEVDALLRASKNGRRS